MLLVELSDLIDDLHDDDHVRVVMMMTKMTMVDDDHVGVVMLMTKMTMI